MTFRVGMSFLSQFVPICPILHLQNQALTSINGRVKSSPVQLAKGFAAEV